MGWGRVGNSYSNVSRSLAIVGDRWTLLIMREVRMGVHRFEEIQAQLGISSHLLASRLKSLTADGILQRQIYSTRPARYEYHPTPRGKDLDDTLLALRNWDLRWGGSDGRGAASTVLIDKKTRESIGGGWRGPRGRMFSFDDVETVVSDAWKAERETNVCAFHSRDRNVQPTSSKTSISQHSRAGERSRSIKGSQK